MIFRDKDVGGHRVWIAALVCATTATGACVTNEPDEQESLSDLFLVSDSLIVADTTFRRLLGERDTGRPWRVTGLGSQSWLWSPSHGRRAAQAITALPRSIGETPYWTGWHRVYGAVAGSNVFHAVNLVYLIRVYGPGGILVDSIDVAPKSWRQAPSPAQGDFVVGGGRDLEQDREKMCAYLKDATFITGLATVSDSVLVVLHGRYSANVVDPGCNKGPSTAVTSEYANVFVNGVNVVRDARAPGEILGYASGRIVFVRYAGDAARDDDSSYTLIEYKAVSPKY